MVRDIKVARNGAFDNKENKEVVLGPEQEEIVPGPYEKSSCAILDNKPVCNYLFFIHYSKSSLIIHYALHGSMCFIIYFKN